MTVVLWQPARLEPATVKVASDILDSAVAEHFVFLPGADSLKSLKLFLPLGSNRAGLHRLDKPVKHGDAGDDAADN